MGYRWETPVSECSQICPGQQWHQLPESFREELLLHTPLIGPYNTERLILFLEKLHCRLTPVEKKWEVRHFVIVWDNATFHHSHAVTGWFAAHPTMQTLFLPPYSPFLNPIEKIFSAWRWKVHDHNPHTEMSLLDTMNAACKDTSAEACGAWICHAKIFFLLCLARDNIRCDVDENMWPNAGHRLDRLFGFCL